MLSRLFGHSFAVVTDHFKAVPELRDRVRLYGLEGNCRAVDAIDWFVTDMVLDPMTVAKDTYVKVQDVMRTTGAETVVIGCTIVSACYELAVLRGDADLAALSVINPNVMAVKLAEMFADLAATKQYRISRAGYYQQHASHDADEAHEIMDLLGGRSATTSATGPLCVMRSVVVVGGGLVGTATAYFAAREGMQVTLLEQRHTGYGASGRNPGFVWLHCRNPGWGLEISLAGRALYDELAHDLPRAVRVPRRGRRDLLQDARARRRVRGVREGAPGGRARHGADRRQGGASSSARSTPTCSAPASAATTPRSTRPPSSPRSPPEPGPKASMSARASR